jgi:anti-sigma factor RsiW
MTHPNDEQWMEYLYGELDEQQAEALASHLTQCAACRERVDRWRGTMADLDAWRLPEAGRPRTARSVFRWAAAAVLLVSAGMGTGLLLARSQPDVEALAGEIGAVLAPQLQQELVDQLRRDRDQVLAAREQKLRDDVRAVLQKELTHYSLETLAASRAATDQRLAELSRSLDGQRMQEYGVLVRLMDRLNQQWQNDATAMRGDLTWLALETGDELARTRKNIFEVMRTLSAEDPGSSVPKR